MMIIVDKQGREYVWHVGTPKVQDLDVTLVQADGHELELVVAAVQGIPTAPRKRVVVWRGDLAQFVYDNALP